MEQNWFEKINLKIIFFCIFEVIFLAIGIKVITGLLDENIEVEQTIEETKNLTAFLDDVPKEKADEIKQSLYEIAALNIDISDNVDLHDLVVRDDKITRVYYQATDVEIINLIVDIESIGQSYRIATFWSNDKNNSFIYTYGYMFQPVFCVDEDDWIYGEYQCRDLSINRGSDYFAYSLLDYFEPQNGSVEVLDSDLSYGRTIPIYPKVKTEAGIEAEVKELKDFVEAIGFDRDRYNFVYKIGE